MVNGLSFEQLGSVGGGLGVSFSDLEFDINAATLVSISEEAMVAALAIWACPTFAGVRFVGGALRLGTMSGLVYLAHRALNSISGSVSGPQLQASYN